MVINETPIKNIQFFFGDKFYLGAKKCYALHRKKEKIFVTEDEVAERINEIAASYHKWPQEIKTYYERHNLMSQLRSDLKEEKIKKFLREKAKITE